jgi:hypothetical protein
MRESKSDPHPDISTRRLKEGFNTVQPVTVAGECKQSKRVIETRPRSGSTLQVPAVAAVATKTGNAPEVRAQRSASLHATMILMVLYHYHLKKLSAKERNEERIGALDERSFVYGVYYDEEQVVIFAHFPFLRSGSWKFAMVPVMEARFSDATLRDRFSLAVALFTVKRHAQELADWLNKFPWSEYDCMFFLAIHGGTDAP